MSTAAEAAGARTPMGADLAEGLQTLSLDQVITFTRYRRLVLPLDRYVFWVRESLLSQSALYGKGGYNRFRPNQPPKASTPPTFQVQGSLHYATDVRQEAEETYAANRVIFTAEDEVNDLNAIAPGELWIGKPDDLSFPRFAFSSQTSRYRQANLWHYVGFAVYPDMETQVVDSLAGFDASSVVVSNSLPAWLALNAYFPGYGFGNPGIMFYPAFLVPPNLAPPFAAVDVVPEGTRALAAAPTILMDGSHEQLCTDRVKVTLWGTRNAEAMDLLDMVNQYSMDVEAFGIMNVPSMRDERRTQAELQTIAMKKTIEFEVSYLQSRVRQAGLGLIKSSLVSFIVSPNEPTPPIPIPPTPQPPVPPAPGSVVVVTTTPFTAASGTRTLLVNVSGTAIINLGPLGPRGGLPLTVKDISGNAMVNNILVYPDPGKTIDDTPSDAIEADYGTRTYNPLPSGMGWYIT